MAILEITAKTVIVRSGPGTSFPKIDCKYEGQQVEVLERNGSWIKTNEGWLNTKTTQGVYQVKELPDNHGIMTMSNQETRESDNPLLAIGSAVVKAPGDIINSVMNSFNETKIPDWYIYEVQSTSGMDNTSLNNYNKWVSNSLDIDSMKGIHGMPYQFLPSADTRLDGSSGDASLAKFGRKYAERIVTQMPLALLAPGVPKFMPLYSDNDKKSMVVSLLESVKDTALDGIKNADDDIRSMEGRYYDFINKLPAYFNHVDPMCRAAAIFLDLGEEVGIVPGENWTNAKNYTWWKYTNEKLHGVLNTQQCVAFYADAEVNSSESFSNSTGESLLASKTNSLSDAGRELNFLLGTVGSNVGMQIDTLSEDVQSSLQEFDSWLDKVTGSNFIKSIAHRGITIASGARMVFPEIWTDSDYSTSHSLKFKFVSPDHDKLSIYLNCLVPMFHLLGFVAPRQVWDSPNAYESPYLIRAFYKGIFNIDMGIVTSMTINKGAEGAWTIDGLPTVIEIDMDIKDLYSKFMMTYCEVSPTNLFGRKSMAGNVMLMNYIATTCGLNINKPEVTKRADLWNTLFKQNITDIFRKDIFAAVESGVATRLTSLYSRFYLR